MPRRALPIVDVVDVLAILLPLISVRIARRLTADAAAAAGRAAAAGGLTSAR